jgi:hypothetical protein
MVAALRVQVDPGTGLIDAIGDPIECPHLGLTLASGWRVYGSTSPTGD